MSLIPPFSRQYFKANKINYSHLNAIRRAFLDVDENGEKLGVISKREFLLKVSEDVRSSLRFWRYGGGGAWAEATTSAAEAQGGVAVGDDVDVNAVQPNEDDRVWIYRHG